MLKRKKKTGFTCSSFDLLHAGHILMLREAKTVCDTLIVGIQVDPSIDRPEKNKPVQTLWERTTQVDAVKYVDQIFIYDTEADLLELLKNLKPDVRIIGSDYLGKDFTGRDWCLENGVELYFNDRSHNLSTTELRERITNATN